MTSRRSLAPFEGQHFVPIDMQLSTFIKKFSTFSKQLPLLSYFPPPSAPPPSHSFYFTSFFSCCCSFFVCWPLARKRSRAQDAIYGRPPPAPSSLPLCICTARRAGNWHPIAKCLCLWQQHPVLALALTLVLELFLAAASCDDKSLLTDYSTVGTYCRHSLAPTSNNNEGNNNKNNRGSSHKHRVWGGGNKSTEKSNKSRSVSSK